MTCKQFQEQCAVELEKLDCAHGCGIGSEIAEKLRALPLPEVTQEHPTTPNTYGGFSASFYVINNRKPTGQEIFNAGRRSGLNDVEALRTANERLRGLLHKAANGLRWYQDEHPEDVVECDYEMLEQIDEALEGGAA